MRVRKCAARSRTSSRKSTRDVGRVIEDEARAVEQLLDLASASSAGRARGSSAARRAAPPARAAAASAAAPRRRAWRGGRRPAANRRRAGAARRAADGVRVTVPSAGPSGVSTTTWSRPGPRTSSGSSRQIRQQERHVRPDRRELDADEGGSGAAAGPRATHTAAAPSSRRRSSGWRCDRARRARGPRLRKRADRAIAVERSAAAPAAAASDRRWRARARPRGDSRSPRSRSSDDSASSRRAESSRSLAAASERLRAARGGAADRSRPRRACSSRAAASRASIASSPLPLERAADAAVGGGRGRVRVRRRDTRDRASARRPRPPRVSGPKRSRWQRERTVGSSTSGRDGHQHEHRCRRRLFERLQQRVLRFGRCSASAPSTITTRRRPSNGR